MVGSVIAPIAGAAIGGIFGGGGGGGASDAAAAAGVPRNLFAPGLNFGGAVKPFTDQVVRLGPVQSLLDQIGAGRSASIGKLAPLFGQVRPGFGRLTDARVAAIDNARRRATGDLRENLNRRRVLGSSFANDAIGRVENEFAQAEAEARAKSFLEEIELTSQLIESEFNINLESVKSIIDQFNFETTTGVNLQNETQQVLAESARIRQELAIENARGSGAFASEIGGAIGDAIGGIFNEGGGGIFG